MCYAVTIMLGTEKWVSDKVNILGILSAWKCLLNCIIFIIVLLTVYLFFLWCDSKCDCMKFLFCWGTKENMFRKRVVMMFNFKMTWYISGVLGLLAQLLVPFLIAGVFGILSTLLKSVSQILAQPSAAPASNPISASIKELSPGLTKWMGIVAFPSEKARIFPHGSLPGSSQGYLRETSFYLAVQHTPRR